MLHVPARPEEVDRRRAWPTAAATAAVLLLMLASGGLTYRAVSDLSASGLVTDQMRTEQRAADALLFTVDDAETGQRGYLLTGETSYLVPFDAARARLGEELARLDAAAGAASGEMDRVATLKTLLAGKMAELSQNVLLRQAGQAAEALALVRAGRGQQIMDQLRAEVAAVRARGDARIALAQARVEDDRTWIDPAAILSLAALCLCVAIPVWLRHRRSLANAAVQERFTRDFGLTRGMLRDTDGRIIFWGAGLQALYGFTPAMAIGQISHVLLATHFPAPLPDIQAALLRDGDWHGELTHRCADGSLKTVMSHWVLHRDAPSGKLSIVEMAFDVTGVRQADPHRQLALEAAGLGTWMWDVGGTGGMVWDASCVALFNLPAGFTPSFEAWREAVWPEDLVAMEAIVLRLLDPADATDTGKWEFRLTRPDGRTVWLAGTGLAQFTPDPVGPAGRAVVRMAGTLRDITAEKDSASERERVASLLHTIIETSPGPIFAKNRNGIFLLANAAALALIGKPWRDVAGRNDFDVLEDPQQAATVMANDQRVMAGGEAEEIEEMVGSNGATRAWLSTKTPMRGADGTVIGLVGVSVEITERKRDEMRRTLMIHELNHRVKNTLATVQAVVTETMQGAEPTMRAALEGRLLALASVHDVLTRESWHSADLGEVVAGALAPFGGGDVSRFRVHGPPLLLQPRAAVALAMGLHELATNASKYGALRAAAGRVTFTWKIVTHPQTLHLTWAEDGGPPVVRPERRSFGSNMIEGALASDLAGTATIHFDPGGVRCIIEGPIDEIVAKPGGTVLPPVGTAW